jgi:hypothetical protein
VFGDTLSKTIPQNGLNIIYAIALAVVEMPSV